MDPPIYRDASIQDDGSPGSTSYKSLLDKYKALCQKYDRAVAKLKTDTEERSGAYQLAWWAMRTLSSAIALFRAGTLLMANERWNELDPSGEDPDADGAFDTGADGGAAGADGASAIHGASVAYGASAANSASGADSASGGPGAWRVMSGDGGPARSYASLEELVRKESAGLCATRAFGVIAVERPATGQMVELQLERMERPGALAVLVAIAHDVTDRTRAERDLEKAREALAHQGRMRAAGEVAAGVAHDLNNVLGALVLRVSLLQADPRCMEAQGPNIEALGRILKDATARVARLHELARRPREIPLQAIDLCVTLSEAVEMARAEVEDRASFAGAPIRIVTSCPPDLRVPAVSAADVRHMFINLLLNARDAMKAKGGTIRLEGERRSDTVVVTVTDEGTGILKEHLEKVFDPFFTTKGDRGTGLGLANAHEVMTALGGTIVAANRPSGGAVMTLTFPLSAERLEPKRPTALKAAPGQRVLLVDDDREQLMIGKAVLELDEQEVDVAEGGEEALARLRSGGSYDLVLCDAGMPDMNGWQVAEEIQKLAPGTKVYLLTGWAQQIAEDDPKHVFVSGVLPKPMSLDRLRAILSPRSRE
jgi:signal transduction histidine kinase